MNPELVVKYTQIPYRISHAWDKGLFFEKHGSSLTREEWIWFVSNYRSFLSSQYNLTPTFVSIFQLHAHNLSLVKFNWFISKLHDLSTVQQCARYLVKMHGHQLSLPKWNKIALYADEQSYLHLFRYYGTMTLDAVFEWIVLNIRPSLIACLRFIAWNGLQLFNRKGFQIEQLISPRKYHVMKQYLFNHYQCSVWNIKEGMLPPSQQTQFKNHIFALEKRVSNLKRHTLGRFNVRKKRRF